MAIGCMKDPPLLVASDACTIRGRGTRNKYTSPLPAGDVYLLRIPDSGQSRAFLPAFSSVTNSAIRLARSSGLRFVAVTQVR